MLSRLSVTFFPGSMAHQRRQSRCQPCAGTFVLQADSAVVWIKLAESSLTRFRVSIFDRGWKLIVA
jgi:hypothetical protein